MFSDEEEDLFSNSKDSFDSIGIALDEEDKPQDENEETQPAAGPSLEGLTTRMGVLGEENEQLDKLARELKTAVSLRREMERGYSKRSDGPPIRCSIETRNLSTGSQLLLLNVENGSPFPLNDWILSMSWKSAAVFAPKSIVKSSSQSFHLPFLDVSQKKSFELLISGEFLHSGTLDPFAFRVELTRGFVISGVNSSFRLALNSALFCTLHLLSFATTAPSKPIRTVSTVSIPCSLVNLLSGSPDDVTASHVLQLLIRPSSLEHVVSASASVALNLQVSSSSQESLSLSVRSESRCFLVDVATRGHSLRYLVSRDIKLYLLHLAAGCHFQPKDSLACLPAKESLDQFYESVIGLYK